MADDKGKTPKAETEEEEATYHVDRLISESDAFFGQPSHVAAGAFDGQQRKNFTRTEAQARIDKWLKSEVETEG